MGDIEKETEFQWVKHGNSVKTSILGRDIVALASGNFFTFVETTRPEKKDIYYNANNEVRGDGIQCFCTHKTLSCFAFSERCRNPRIFVLSYPNFDVIKTFESVTDTNYLALCFSEMEYLIALTGIPDFKIFVWNWRTSEKLYSQETQLTNPNQILRVSPSSPIQIMQATGSERKVNFWDLNVCFKKFLFNKTTVDLPENSKPPYSFCYGADGDLYFVDSNSNLYSISSETRICSEIFQCKEVKRSCNTAWPCLTWYKGGVVFTVANEIHFWRRKSPEGWMKIWSFVPKTPYKALLSTLVKDLLVGIDQMNDILWIKGENRAEIMNVRSFGSDFDFLCLVYPVGDHFVTYGNNRKMLGLWNVANGSRSNFFFWTKGKINAIQSNPKWPYLVAVTDEGKVHIINAYESTVFAELEEIWLTSNPLQSVRFRNEGNLFCAANMDLGEFFLLKFFLKVEVLGHLVTDLKIVDYSIVENANGINLLVVPMSQLCCRSGQTMQVYILDEKLKTFEYLKEIFMPSVVTSIVVSPITSKELFCVPHRSRRFFVMNALNGKILGDEVSGHQMKKFSLKHGGKFLFTYGADGLVIVKSAETKKCWTIFSMHHRLEKGIKSIAFDPYMQYVIALGSNGSLVCAYSKKFVQTESRLDNENLLGMSECKQILGFQTVEKSKLLKGLNKPQQEKELAKALYQVGETKKTWVDIRQQEQFNLEEQQSRKEKQNLEEELLNIQTKVKDLLNENYANVPERQLPVQAFDLDKAARRKKLEDGRMEREKEKQIQLATIKNLNKITDIIKRTCWESMFVKGREIHAILAPVSVQSYVILPEDKHVKLVKAWLPENIKTEQFFHRGDFFKPWVPRTDSELELHINSKFQMSSLDVTQTIKTKYDEEQIEDEKIKMNVEEQKQKYLYTGTSTHNFVDVDLNHYSQFELTTFFQSHQEIQLIEVDIKKLMNWFNKEFAETFALKEREMAFVYERNNRLRHIISELSFFHFSPTICKTQIYDPQWAPQEDPETILKVEDYEIKVPMYMSESRMELLKKKEDEEEKFRQMLMADDFKERALMVMMDGVLEKLWEDEIKKDVPKPKFMVDKDPDNWNEEDLKAARVYEEAVKHLTSERERYRKILETEWGKTIAYMKDSVLKFDDKVIKLQLLKLKVESAIGQETLKCVRIRQRCFQRIELNRKEHNIKTLLIKNEKKMESMAGELNKLTEILNDCKNYYETLQNKDRNLDKNFKREFPEFSPVICEQLYKLSKKRPKLIQKAATYSTVLNDMGKCVVSGSKPEYMPAECIQYLKDIDSLDNHSNAPASISLQAWELTCKLRRVKIDCELKIKACAIDLADAETTISNYQKALKASKEHHVLLQNQLQSIRAEKLNSALNYQIQLVLKKGLVEIPLSGQISDFAECALVTKVILNDINKSINKMGLQKIKAMQKAANFRKGIIYKEWEHKKLRMEIEDLRSQLETVEKLQVLKELQAMLVARARKFSEEKGFLYLENELSKAKERYAKAETDIFSKIDELDLKIEKIEVENQKLNSMIAEVNVEVNEMNLERDKDFDKKNLAENVRRMKKVRERSKLVRTIQEQHNEILVLQTELELLRLKTYPAIKHKVT